MIDDVARAAFSGAFRVAPLWELSTRFRIEILQLQHVALGEPSLCTRGCAGFDPPPMFFVQGCEYRACARAVREGVILKGLLLEVDWILRVELSHVSAINERLSSPMGRCWRALPDQRLRHSWLRSDQICN